MLDPACRYEAVIQAGGEDQNVEYAQTEREVGRNVRAEMWCGGGKPENGDLEFVWLPEKNKRICIRVRVQAAPVREYLLWDGKVEDGMEESESGSALLGM